MASTQEPSAEITTEFAILGAGAIGSILGAHLARAGRKVLMLARGERAEQIRRHGLQIKGLAAFSQPVPVLSDASRLARAEILIVATKTYSMDAALEALRSADIENTFSIQNGLAKNEQLAAVWGESRVLGALADTSGELLPTGEVLFTRNEQLYVGEISGGESVRARNIAHILDASGIRTSAVVDIRSLEWSKFTAWVALMVPSVTTRATTWQYLTDGGSALVVVRLVRELGALASALNIPLSDRAPLPISTIACGPEADAVTIVQALGSRLKESAPAHRMSSLQDLEAGRPLELEETLGFAVHKAAQLGLTMPLLGTFYPLLASINRMRGHNRPRA